MSQHPMQPAIYFLSCLPQFCLHSDVGKVLDMRSGAFVGCFPSDHPDYRTNLQISWPGRQASEISSVGAAKYMELHTMEAVRLVRNGESYELGLQAALLAIGHGTTE